MHFKFKAFNCYQETARIDPKSFFGKLIKQINTSTFKANKQHKEYLKEMVTFRNLRVGKYKAKHPTAPCFKPVLPLVPETLASRDDNKDKFISLEVKTRAGGPDKSNSYKKYVRIFDEDEPQQWIDLIKEVREIWIQNSTNGPTDRAATLKAVLKGESLIAFESALDDARVNPDPDVAALVAMTTDHVDEAIAAVATTVFPHRALELQKLWMQRYMKKPFEMKVRKLSSAVTRINNCLPLFPGGTAASKFSEDEILGLLEWAVPQTWRSKFDLDGYVPSMDTKVKFITECEAMERHQEAKKGGDDDNDNNKNKKAKNSKFENSGPTNKKSESSKSAGGSFFCKECGRNASHNTDKCYTLKNRAAAAGKTSPNASSATLRPTFSKRTFRKEVNAMMRKAGKKKVLGIMATSLKRAQSKDAKRATKDSAKTDVSSDDESDESVHGITCMPA